MIIKKNSLMFLLSDTAPAEKEVDVADGDVGSVLMLSVAGATLGALGPGAMVALANTGGTTAGAAAMEDKKVEASERATEAAGGRTAAAVVTLPAWAIATDASDKANEACSINDSCGPAVQDAGIEVTVTVTVSVLR